MKPIRNSAKAIIIHEDRILLIQNTDENGYWYTLPGGGQGFGETLTDAVLRECKEELGTEVAVGDLMFVREYIGANHEFAAVDFDQHQVDFMFECFIATWFSSGMNRVATDVNDYIIKVIPLLKLP